MHANYFIMNFSKIFDIIQNYQYLNKRFSTYIQILYNISTDDIT